MPNETLHTRRNFFELSLLALISACTDGARQFDGRASLTPSWLTDFEAFTQDLVTTSRIPGVTLSIAQHGKVLYEKAFQDASQRFVPDVQHDQPALVTN